MVETGETCMGNTLRGGLGYHKGHHQTDILIGSGELDTAGYYPDLALTFILYLGNNQGSFMK